MNAHFLGPSLSTSVATPSIGKLGKEFRDVMIIAEIAFKIAKSRFE